MSQSLLARSIKRTGKQIVIKSKHFIPIQILFVETSYYLFLLPESYPTLPASSPAPSIGSRTHHSLCELPLDARLSVRRRRVAGHGVSLVVGPEDDRGLLRVVDVHRLDPVRGQGGVGHVRVRLGREAFVGVQTAQFGASGHHQVSRLAW